MMRNRKTLIISLLLTVITGACLPLAFAPFNLYSLAFLCPAILLFQWFKHDFKLSITRGWLFGVGFFGTGTSWIYQSLYHFGNMTLPLAILATCLFVFIMALYPAALGLLTRLFAKKVTPALLCLCVFPSLWVILEYARTHLLTGFPWLLLGYSQTSNPLAAFAPIIGTYGLSFIVTLFSGAIVLILINQKRQLKSYSLALLLVIISISLLLQHHHWTKPINQPIKATLIQGDIAQKMKWDRNYLIHNIRVYEKLTQKNLGSQLIIWPEGAVPVLSSHAGSLIKQLNALAKQHNTTILFGIPIASKGKYYNGLLMVGMNKGHYLKKHLVAFGEYVPLPSIIGKIMAAFKVPMSDFSKGPDIQPPLPFNHGAIGPFICYEVAFPNLVLSAAKHANLLVTLSDDSWFGRSIALAQHLQMAKMAALQTRRYMLASTNTGITAVITPFGQIIKGANIGARTAITATITPMVGTTPLMIFSYYPLWVFITLLLLFAIWRSRQKV